LLVQSLKKLPAGSYFVAMKSNCSNKLKYHPVYHTQDKQKDLPSKGQKGTS